MSYGNTLNLSVIIKFDFLTAYNKFCSTDSTGKDKNGCTSGSQDAEQNKKKKKREEKKGST